MTLNDRVKMVKSANLMLSEDYKDRLKAEYMQIDLRTEALRKAISHRKINLTPLELDIMQEQLLGMIKYRNSLEMRLAMLKIDTNY